MSIITGFPVSTKLPLRLPISNYLPIQVPMNNFSTLENFRAHNARLKDVQLWRGLKGVRVWVGSVEAREAMEFRYTAGLKLGYLSVTDPNARIFPS